MSLDTSTARRELPPPWRPEERATAVEAIERKIAEVIPDNEQMRERLALAGIADVNVFRKLLDQTHTIPDEDIFTEPSNVSKEIRNEWVEDLIASISHTEAHYMNRWPAEPKYILAILSATKDVWHDTNAIKKLVWSLTTRNVLHCCEREVFRTLGLMFYDFSPFLDNPENVKTTLLHEYPIGMLPSLSLDECSDEIRKQYELDNAIEYDHFRLLPTPLALDPISKRAENGEFTVCDAAEGRFEDAIKDPRDHTKFFINGELLGVLKHRAMEEWTFLALRSVISNNRPVLLKGGIYQFHDIRFDIEKDSIELAEIHEPIGIIPLREFHDKKVFVSKKDGVETYRDITLESISQNCQVSVV